MLERELTMLEKGTMDRTSTLRKQAVILRKLAGSVDVATMKADLLALAEKCDELAEVAATGD